MSVDEKVDFLMSLGETVTPTSEHLKEVVKLSSDKDAFVRCQTAVALVYFDCDIAQQTLIRLACDEDSLVRTEAYDSLALFEDEEVLRFLENAIEKEKDEIACSYAIMSWTDIAIAIEDKEPLKAGYIFELEKNPKISESEHCMLSCYRARYYFGEKGIINDIIEYLKHEDYHVRSSVIAIFEEIVDDDNIKTIKTTLNELLGQETTRAVRSRVEKFFDNY